MIIGIGIDIVEIKRIRETIERQGEAFLKKIFCDEEIAYAKRSSDPSKHYAARFAAKEAVFKALGSKPYVAWKKIRIINDENGKPCCDYLENDFPHNIMISLSHTEDYAVANAIITQKS
ncbi:MAG: holo-ACP synthase [Candidatus Omnitrophota bacterium]